MFRLLSLIAFIICGLSNTFLHAQNSADDIIGIWELDDKASTMKIYKSGNTYSAKLLWGKDIVEADGKTSKKDIHNPDKTLRNRDLTGITYLTGLTYDDDEYTNGRIYNALNGKTYKCYVWLENGALHLRGYLGLPILGQTTIWNRLPSQQ